VRTSNGFASMLALSDTALAYIAIAATALPPNARGP
jgi:hypothetical protein